MANAKGLLDSTPPRAGVSPYMSIQPGFAVPQVGVLERMKGSANLQFELTQGSGSRNESESTLCMHRLPAATCVPETSQRRKVVKVASQMNYTSSMHLLGLPLVHVAIGLSEGSSAVRGIAKGWIAVGDIAIAVIFAFGGGAIAVRAANGGLALA